MKAILTDIEGTTTSIDFVSHVLFPYAKKHMPTFLEKHLHDSVVSQTIKEIEESYHLSSGNLKEVGSLLNRWMEEDKKETSLKKLQGLIWEEGYHKGVLKGHLYADVYENLDQWKKKGYEIYIYSSGSVLAQKLLFTHTDRGDITPIFSGYFDTTSGGKKEMKSYCTIAEKINLAPTEILFLSDSEEELDAAQLAGLKTICVSRDQIKTSSKHQTIQNFNQIIL